MRRQLVLCACLAALVFLVFSPALRSGFLAYDDADYVTSNPHVNTGISVRNAAWALTAAHASNWHPLTWLSHALDCTLFGLRPAGHHLTSLLLHLANTLLLFLWLSGATRNVFASAFVAAVFGLHPLHVESVAWIAERKDVLSTLFWLLALLAYGSYVKKPGVARYLLVAGLLAAGLMAKQMLVTVPLLLLLLDWWPLGRRGALRLVIEKLPLFTLSLLASAAAFWAQHRAGSTSTMEQLPVSLRLENAALSYLQYLWKTIWPVNLAVFYPFPVQGVALWKVAACVVFLAAVSAAVFVLRRQRPWLAAGWAWFLLTLLPVIGIVQVGSQAMADRYMYVPMIGILIAVTWESSRWLNTSPGAARLVPAAAIFALAACAVLTWRQIHVWKDGVTLFTHALAVTSDNFVAHNNLGVELDRQGRHEEALVHYNETLRIKPGDRHGEENYSQAVFARGERLFAEGKLDEALASFHDGLRYRPRNALAHTYTGLILTSKQQPAAAIAEFQTALAIDPTLSRAHTGLGVALAWMGRDSDARRAFENALRCDPANVEAHFDLGLVLASLGQRDAALKSFDAALRLKPDFAPALAARAMLMNPSPARRR